MQDKLNHNEATSHGSGHASNIIINDESGPHRIFIALAIFGLVVAILILLILPAVGNHSKLEPFSHPANIPVST